MLAKTEIVVFSLLCCMVFKTGFAVAGLCFPEHPQAAVCRAKFVIRATVISVDWEEDLKKKDTIAPTTVATTKAATQAPTTAEVTEAATQPPSTATTTKAATTAAETEAATTSAATKAPTTKEATVEASTAPKTEARTTKEAPTTIAATTAAATEAATTSAAPEEATKAATEKATTQAATEAATTQVATEEASTAAASEAPTKAATTVAVTEKQVKTTETEIKENEIESNKKGISKATTTEENNENQGDSKPIFEPAFVGVPAYFLKPKIIRVELRKLYKGLRVVNAKVGEQLNITFSSPHRTHLEVGKTYLLTGFNYGESLLMNECNWHKEWDELTTTQKLGLRRYYWLYCRCNIRFCPGGSCARNPRVCSWVVPISLIDGKKADLLSSYSVCMVRCGGCGWHNPEEFVDCSRA